MTFWNAFLSKRNLLFCSYFTEVCSRSIQQTNKQFKLRFRTEKAPQIVPAFMTRIPQLSQDQMAPIIQTAFWNSKFSISIGISLQFVPNWPVKNKPTLFQMMDGLHTGDKSLSESMMAWFADTYMQTIPSIWYRIAIKIRIFASKHTRLMILFQSGISLVSYDFQPSHDRLILSYITHLIIRMR